MTAQLTLGSRYLAENTSTSWLEHDPPQPDPIFSFSRACKMITAYTFACVPIGMYLGFRDRYKLLLEDIGVHSSRRPTFAQNLQAHRPVLLRAASGKGLQIFTLVFLYGVAEQFCIYYRDKLVC